MAVKQRRKTRMTVTVAVIRLFDTPRNGCSARLSRKKFTAGRGGVSHPSKVLRGIGSGVGKFRYPLGKERWKQWPHGFGKPNEILNDRLELSSEGVGRYNVQSILQALESDKTISMSKQPLSEVCSNTELFLRSKDPDLGTTSEDRILRSLLLVQAAIEVLSTARIQHDKSFIIPQDGQIGIRIDETCMANYQHLLLRLQTQLLKALTRKSAAASSLTDLDKTQRKRLNWFSEFPDGQRPLSTTWPWSIKPSLAVLWGVCWMFPVLPVYDETDQQSQQNVSIRVRIPQQRVLQDGQLNGWNPPQPDEWFNYGVRCLENTGIRPQIGSPSSADDGASCAGNGQGDGCGGPHAAFQNVAGLAPRSRGTLSRAEDAQPHFQFGRSELGSRQAYYPSVPPPDVRRNGPYSIPGFSGISTEESEFAFAQQQQLDVESLPHNSWSLAPSDTQSALPQQSGHLTYPLIIVNGESQPQSQYLNLNPYQQQQHRALHLNTALSKLGPHPHAMGDCPVTGSSPINTIHERKISLSSNANSTIPTPVSMGPLSPHLSPSPSRRHSTASSQGQPILSPSAAPSQDGEEEYSQKHRSFKRAEEPRRNQDGKLICVKPTCIGVTFDRKCEWSKHMDKHDRPYICTAKGCEKLRGFTYSGGLLRHEREVHKLHGGTKEPLFCPFPDCKRSSGSGFTRKENQQEHIRRVHTRSSSSQGPIHTPVAPSETGNERLPKADSPQQTTTQSETAPLTHLKRKRIAEREYSHEEGPISLHEENKRLRRQLQEKDAVIQRLQARLKELTHAP